MKYEKVHLRAYANGAIAMRVLGAYFRFYDNQRPRQALGYRIPAELFQINRTAPEKKSKERMCSIRPTLVSCAEATGSSLSSAPILSNLCGPPQ